MLWVLGFQELAGALARAMRPYLITTNIDICHNPKANAFYTDVKPIGHVINATLCIDGYVQGFKHWCSTYTRDCVYATESGMIPIQLLTDERYHDQP